MPSKAPPRGRLPSVARYVFGDPIGSGGIGTVYRAMDKKTGRPVAIKVLKASLAQNPTQHHRLVREFRAVTQLEHPNIVRALDIGNDGSVSYLVFELIEGMNLTERVTRFGPLPEAEGVRVITQVAQALHYAHQRNVVHRDVKPDNILLLPDGRAKLTDFGLAKDHNDDQGLTMNLTGLGTPTYMAPEQFAAAKAADPRYDVYSLGATLFTAVTGRLPYSGRAAVGVLVQKMTGTPPSARTVVSSLSLRVDEAIRAALRPDPDQRPQTCLDFFKLLTARGGKRPSAVAPAPAGSERRGAVRHAVGVGVCGVIDPSAVGGGPAPEAWPLVLTDVSAGGVGVVLARRFEPGTELLLELPAEGSKAGHQLATRVVRVEPRGGGHWGHGCTFAAPLSDADLAVLLRSA